MNLIVIFGPPYSGKGTQGKLLAEKLHYIHVSTGDILREEKRLNTAIGNLAAEYSKKGLLVPDDVLETLVDRALLTHLTAPGVILDGYPRTIAQADTLFLLAKKHGITISHVVFLDVSQAELVHRGVERGKTSNREDDRNPDIIQKRIEVYHNETKPVADYYEKRGLVTHVKGEGAIDDITEEITRRIKK